MEDLSRMSVMKRSALTHCAWAVVSLLALGAGWMLKTGSHHPGSNAGAHASASSKSSRYDSTTGGGSGAVESGGVASRSERSAADGNQSSASRALSELEIEHLGAQFRESANPVERRLAFSQLLAGLTAENALMIREQIEHLPHNSAEFREFHYAWGAVAGTDAVIFGAGTKKADMSPALAGWASVDPDAAVAWIKNIDMENDPRFDDLLKGRKIPSDGLRHHLLEGVVHGLAAADPDLAVRFIKDLQANGHERLGGMVGSVAEAILRGNSPAEAALWSEALPEGRIRGEAMERVARRYVHDDPEAAAIWAGQIAELPEAAGAIAKIGGTWASDEPQEAVEWLSELPAGQGQNAGMHWALRQWAEKDPTAAGEYLYNLPQSSARDAAVSGYSRRVAHEDPLAAMQWAATIAADDQRVDTMIGVGHAWRRKDPAGAAAWLESSDLPEKVQNAILNPSRDRKH